MEPEDLAFSPAHLAALITMAEKRQINSSVAKQVFEVMFTEDIDPEKYVEEKGLKTEQDDDALEKTVTEVLAANPQSVADYKGGKEKALGFLVGQVMKAMKGKVDPACASALLKEKLS